MAEIIRLKRWTTYQDDGRSSVSYSPIDNKTVAVAVIVGYEPLKLLKDEDPIDVDGTILKLAAHIRKCRKERKAK